jgi:hypothetical protein
VEMMKSQDDFSYELDLLLQDENEIHNSGRSLGDTSAASTLGTNIFIVIEPLPFVFLQ